MIVDEELISRNTSLYHYTSTKSLVSILEKGCFWASHYSCANDLSELSHTGGVILDEIKLIIGELIDECQNIPDFNESLNVLGGKTHVINDESVKIYYMIYGYHLKNDGVIRSLSDQFIVSFCSHDKLGRYTQQNGLLSQWIHYGGTTGCAIVFNTAKFCEALNKEEQKYAVMVNLCEMVYMDESYKNNALLSKLRQSIKKFYRLFVIENRGYSSQDMESLLGNINDLISGLKHEAFKNEHEIRTTLSIPPKDGNEIHRTQKKLEYRSLRNLLVPYIEVFDKETFPEISQIIIGPSREQHRIANSLKRLCEPLNIDVQCSATPLAV